MHGTKPDWDHPPTQIPIPFAVRYVIKKQLFSSSNVMLHLIFLFPVTSPHLLSRSGLVLVRLGPWPGLVPRPAWSWAGLVPGPGPWSLVLVPGPRSLVLVRGPWSLAHGPWSLVLGPGLWPMVPGPGPMVPGARSLVLVPGPWPMVRGPWSWSLVPGPWCMVPEVHPRHGFFTNRAHIRAMEVFGPPSDAEFQSGPL